MTHNRLARQIKSTYKIYSAEWDEKAESIVMDGAGQERLTYLKDVDNHVRQDMAQLTRIVASLDKKGTSYTSDDVVRMFDGESTDGFASNARASYVRR